jgi:hypothetical protein
MEALIGVKMGQKGKLGRGREEVVLVTLIAV